MAGVGKHRLSISGTTGTRSTIAGAGATMNTYIAPGGQEGSNKYVHDDVHSIVFVPGSSDSVYFCTDGGIFLTTNASTATASSVTFQSCNSGLQTAQFFGPVGQSQTDADLFLGGLQDNNTAVYDGASRRWKRVIGGDGGPSAIKPDNNNIILSSRDARAVYKSTNKAGNYTQTANAWGSVADSRTGFMAPIAFSKSNPNIVYLGSDNLHKSTDAGSTWTGNTHTSATNYIEKRNKTAVALAVSPVNENKVYVSTSPFAQYDNDVDEIHVNGNPNFFKTTNGGSSFTNIMTGLPNRFVMDIAIHPTDDNVLWVVMGGYGSSHVFKSTDGGATWTDIDRENLPDVPTNAIMLDPFNSDIIYVGNDLGVFVTADGGINWMDYGGGFWDATLIMDLVPVPGGKVRAATHGKGIYEKALFNPSILPVTFLSFKGNQQANSNVLQWKVSEESNMSHYLLERSLDGNNFYSVATIKAKNVSHESTYTHSDANISSSFYRVRSVDKDGTYQFTHILFMKRESADKMQVIGNPFYNEIAIQLHLSRAGKVQINLYDSKGALIAKEAITASSGLTNRRIKGLSRLPAGIYQVEAIANNQRWVQKLIKK